FLRDLTALFPLLPQEAGGSTPAGDTTFPTTMTGFPQLLCTTRDDVTPRLRRDGPGPPRQRHGATRAGGRRTAARARADTAVHLSAQRSADRSVRRLIPRRRRT